MARNDTHTNLHERQDFRHTAKGFAAHCVSGGLILTKLDGSGKGGIAFHIYEQLGIAPRFVGTGEEPEEFSVFGKGRFVSEVL